MKIVKKIAPLFVLSLVVLCLLIFLPKKISAEECQNIGDLKEKISCYEGQLGVLSNQSKTLQNQIAQFDAQIKLTTLKISQTEGKISTLGGRIDLLEGSLDELSNSFSSRAVETYKMAKATDPFILLISSPNLTEAVARFHYLRKIQEADRDLLNRLQEAQTNYKGEKKDQEELQAELATEKLNLDRQKAAKASLLEATKNDEKKYQQLLVEAKAQLAAMQRFVANQGGATILQNQTKCDGWGCYYNQRDALWGNMGLGGSAYSVANYGCLVTSVSMLASHYGKNIKPSDIAANPSAFVPGTGYLYHSFWVNGISVSINAVPKSVLDSELSAGRPVIAGLYSGPDHFIVILRKEGDDYIMNDPFLENGSNRKLTEKYSVDVINSLRLVSFN